MSDSKVDNEPSIEEILSSIRQIINEDDEDVDAETAPVAKSEDKKEEEVLDLAAFSEEDEQAVDVAKTTPPESEAAVMPDEKINADDLDAMFDAPVQETKDDAPADDFAFEETPEPKFEKEPSTQDAVEESILSDDTVNAAAASLTKLAEANVKIDHSHAKGDGSITLEDVVKQMLKPMMKEWLDSNLPPLVERLVEKEIRKISNR